MNEVVKPASLVHDDFIKALIKMTNESKLPLFVVELILKDFMSVIHQSAQQQFLDDKERYQQLLAAKKNEQTKEEGE